MDRNLLIEIIYSAVPHRRRGMNRYGQHVIQVSEDPTKVFATLEKLPTPRLEMLADKHHVLHVPTERLEMVAEMQS